MLVFLLKIHLDALSFIPLGGSTKFQTWLVHEVYNFKSFLRINIIYYFQVIVIHNWEVLILLMHDMSY